MNINIKIVNCPNEHNLKAGLELLMRNRLTYNDNRVGMITTHIQQCGVNELKKVEVSTFSRNDFKLKWSK